MSRGATVRIVGLALGLVCGASVSALGCRSDLGEIVTGCEGLQDCRDARIVDGNFAITRVRSIDGFFLAVLDVRAAAASVSHSVRAELEGMAVTLGIETPGDVPLEDLAVQVRDGIEAKLAANVSGRLVIEFQPPACEADLEASTKAAVECDLEADPETLAAKCEGSCEVTADVAAQCSAMGTLSCEGPAPDFACAGTCSGSCQLASAAACDGTCNGSCDDECSVCAGGACETDAEGNISNCAGSCSGGCRGDCMLDAGGACTGRCEGTCEYVPASGRCDPDAVANCDVSEIDDAACVGDCEGNITAPRMRADCLAQVEATAKAEVVCTPPKLNVDFQLQAGLDADARAAFKVWLEGFERRFAAMLAARAKLDIVGTAAVDLVFAANGPVAVWLEAAGTGGNVNLETSVGILCALEQLPDVAAVLEEAQVELVASASASAEIIGAVGG